MKKQKVTAGREALGKFAPQFAELNDDILFGEVWSREEKLSPRDRSLITVTALMTSGIFDNSLKFHMEKAKENGLSKEEIAETLTQLAFYSGWPKAWAAFNIAKEVWKEEESTNVMKSQLGSGAVFPVGEKNDAFAQYFAGQSYLKMLTTKGVGIGNVTFEPGCRNNWHIHHKGGQILLVTGGCGYYQEWGKEAQKLQPGDVVSIPAEVKHWHGAAKNSWFSNLAVEVPADEASNEWLEPMADEDYEKLR